MSANSGQKPSSLSWLTQVPITDTKGKPTRALQNWIQQADTKLNASLTLLGVNPEAQIEGTENTVGAVATKTQNLTETGTLPTTALTGSVGAAQVGFTLDSVPDGAKRFAVENGAGLNGVAQVDSANLPIINFADAAHKNKILDNIGDGVTYQRFSRVASGQTALGTSLIAGGGHNAVTVSAPNVLATDQIVWSFSGAPPAAYLAGQINVIVYVTAANVNFVQVNPTAGNITPGAVSINWEVIR
jgi:hypothetical protein